MLGVFGQQCYVGLYGALVLRCCSVFQKKKKQKQKAKDVFQSVVQAARKEKSEFSQSRVKPMTFWAQLLEAWLALTGV